MLKSFVENINNIKSDTNELEKETLSEEEISKYINKGFQLTNPFFI